MPERHSRINYYNRQFWFVLCTAGLVAGGVFCVPNSASAQIYNVVSGTDTTAESAELTASDINKLKTNDDKPRMGSNGGWPNNGAYDENKYIEFRFGVNLTGKIESAKIYHDYRRSGAMEGAKLIVSGGGIFMEYAISKGTNDKDVLDVIDISKDFDTIEEINDLKIRFTAFRLFDSDHPDAKTTTSHDYIALDVETSGGNSTPSPTPSPVATPTPTPTPTPSPSRTPTPTTLATTRTPTPAPIISATPSAFITKTPTPTATVEPTQTTIVSSTVPTPSSSSKINTSLVQSKSPLPTENMESQLIGLVANADNTETASSDPWFSQTRQLGLALVVIAGGIFWYFVARKSPF